MDSGFALVGKTPIAGDAYTISHFVAFRMDDNQINIVVSFFGFRIFNMDVVLAKSKMLPAARPPICWLYAPVDIFDVNLIRRLWHQ